MRPAPRVAALPALLLLLQLGPPPAVAQYDMGPAGYDGGSVDLEQMVPGYKNPPKELEPPPKSSNAASLVWLEKRKRMRGVKVLPSGLMYKVLRKGKGGHHPTAESEVEVHYDGATHDGNTFDSSYERGEPSVFVPEKTIRGWTEALLMMVEGDKWLLYVPSELAYGNEAKGEDTAIGGAAIKPGDALLFTVELVRIRTTKRLTKAEAERLEEERRQRELADLTAAPACQPFGRRGCLPKDRDYIALMLNKPAHAVARELKREREEAAEWRRRAGGGGGGAAADTTSAIAQQYRRRRVDILAALAAAVATGPYVVVGKATVRADVGGAGDVVAELAPGAEVRVAETQRNAAGTRMRGRIDAPAGWISLLNLETGRRWAEPAPPAGGGGAGGDEL